LQNIEQNEKPLERRDTAAQLDDIQRMLLELTENVHSAFVKDEDGKPNFYGHREEHKANAKKQAALAEYQQEVTKNIIKFVATVIISFLGLIGSGLGDTILQLLRSK
jgi:hypothetical protein